MALFGGCGGSAAGCSQLHIVHTYESYHTKGEPWNSLMKAAAATLQKRPHPPPTQKKIYMNFLILELTWYKKKRIKSL